MVISVLNKENLVKDVVVIGVDLYKVVFSFEFVLCQVCLQVSKFLMIGSIVKGDVIVENMLLFKFDVVVMILDQKEVVEKVGFFQKMD